MSPLLLNTHPSHTYVSIAAQHPPSTHPCLYPCLHCCSAPTQHTPMSPLLFNTHPAHTHVSIADQHTSLSRCRNENSTSSTPKLSKIGSLTNLTWPPPWSLFSLHYGAGNPRRRRRRRKIRSCPATDSTPREKNKPFRAPSL